MSSDIETTTSDLKFSTLALSQDLLEVVGELGFTELTPIQAKSIPHLLEGSDIVGQSVTGSGKTAAFALPILQKIDLQKRKIQAAILCPTRELCTQVARDVRKLGRKHPGLQVLIVAGGQPIQPQVQALSKGVHIVVGTPGRLLDHIERESINLSSLNTLVLDEADRMLDMGFEEQMEAILKGVPRKRQTVFFSATFPESIELMSKRYQNKPLRITIEETNARPKIQQVVYEVDHDKKLQTLQLLLQKHNPESAIVFCNMKVTVTEIDTKLSQAGLSASSLHGDLEQYDRDKVMAKFRNHSVRILVATDVAARGIDIANLDLVVNYDLPSKPEVYVHRIGRTGRAGQEGIAISFANPREKNKIQDIESHTGETLKWEFFSALEATVEKSPVEAPVAKMETLYISLGRKEKMRPGDILGALTGDAGKFKATDIGKIEIHDNFTYVAISKEIAPTALKKLEGTRIKNLKFKVSLVK